MSSETKEAKSEAKENKEEKKEKKQKEIKKINVKSVKANAQANIDPRTGTRFAPGSARQLAFDIVYKGAKEGKSVKEIRGILENTRKDKGAAFNLDIGYVNFVAASHPEMFEVFNDGTIKVVKDPVIDKEAAAKFEKDREDKKKKAEQAREERKNKASGEKSDKKEEKSEKKEKKHDGEKPSKKEKED